jgi:hypothetical protein
VGAVEFGGIVLSAYSDHRRRLGERAAAARLLSAAVAGGAVAVNWMGHPDPLQGGFFAGMSALGYLVWLLHSGARRRDQLRATGSLPPIPPAYGLWAWLRHPALTRHARALALADPTLGLYRSLAAARETERTQRRQAAIAALLHRKLAAGRDRLAGEIAVTVYDLDTIAARLAATADYDGLTALLAADLTPDRLTTTPAPDPSHPVPRDASRGTQAPDQTTTDTPTGTGIAGAVGTRTGTPARTRTGGRRAGRTGTRTAKTTRPRTDADLTAALADVPREPDGTVPVRRAATHLGCGVDRARRLLATQGLLRTTPTDTPSVPAGVRLSAAA